MSVIWRTGCPLIRPAHKLRHRIQLPQDNLLRLQRQCIQLITGAGAFAHRADVVQFRRLAQTPGKKAMQRTLAIIEISRVHALFERRLDPLRRAAVEGHLHPVVGGVEARVAADRDVGEGGDDRLEVLRELLTSGAIDSTLRWTRATAVLPVFEPGATGVSPVSPRAECPCHPARNEAAGP